MIFMMFYDEVCRRKAKERMVFLFSDMLLYAKQNLTETGYYIHTHTVTVINTMMHYIELMNVDVLCHC